MYMNIYIYIYSYTLKQLQFVDKKAKSNQTNTHCTTQFAYNSLSTLK